MVLFFKTFGRKKEQKYHARGTENRQGKFKRRKKRSYGDKIKIEPTFSNKIGQSGGTENKAEDEDSRIMASVSRAERKPEKRVAGKGKGPRGKGGGGSSMAPTKKPSGAQKKQKSRSKRQAFLVFSPMGTLR